MNGEDKHAYIMRPIEKNAEGWGEGRGGGGGGGGERMEEEA